MLNSHNQTGQIPGEWNINHNKRIHCHACIYGGWCILPLIRLKKEKMKLKFNQHVLDFKIGEVWVELIASIGELSQYTAYNKESVM